MGEQNRDHFCFRQQSFLLASSAPNDALISTHSWHLLLSMNPILFSMGPHLAAKICISLLDAINNLDLCLLTDF
jgi:hypothetical protein